MEERIFVHTNLTIFGNLFKVWGAGGILGEIHIFVDLHTWTVGTPVSILPSYRIVPLGNKYKKALLTGEPRPIIPKVHILYVIERSFWE